MLVLRSSPASPFGRKVKIAARELGLIDRITIEAADTTNPNDSLRAQNPLGKIPVLLTEDGTALFDSRVILEYIDHMAGGGRIIPADFDRRMLVLRLQALADGISDAALLQVYEVRFRAEGQRDAAWIDYQAAKVERGLDYLESAPPTANASVDVGDIALACTLGYLDLRFDGRWRADHPRLVAWLDGFAARVPAFAATRMPV